MTTEGVGNANLISVGEKRRRGRDLQRMSEESSEIRRMTIGRDDSLTM